MSSTTLAQVIADLTSHYGSTSALQLAVEVYRDEQLAFHPAAVRLPKAVALGRLWDVVFNEEH